jgi:cardiolipin synthase
MRTFPSAEGFTEVNRVRLVHAGQPYFDTLDQMIRDARESIHIQMYIYDDDDTGQKVAEALKEAVARGVSVYLVADGYASQVMSRAFMDDLMAGGIHFKYFQPLLRSRYFYFGRRLHHKLVVVDARYAMVGGVNISNRYNDMPNKPAWFDFALWVEGEIARSLCVLAWKTWNSFPSYMGRTPCEQQPIHFKFGKDEQCRVRMRRNDWVRGKNQISASYIQLLRGAQKRVVILSSYFLPGRAIRYSLRRAVTRGVRISVILAGRSDVMLAKRAERWYYHWLLQNGIELYEYQKSILHGKLATADDQWMTIGSYNVNDISAHASIELNLDVDDPAFAREIRVMLDNIMLDDCKRITPEDYVRSGNWWIRFVNWGSYVIFRVLLLLFTFYFRQHK